jgi:CheY-like chemotaxis protein
MEMKTMSKKALIADNDFYLTAFIAEELESAGYDVLKAYNGLEALDLLDQHDIDLLVVDLIMPVVNGRQLIRFLRDRSPKIRFPIVALFIVEEGEAIEDVAAEYFVVKGPIDDMAANIASVLDIIDKGPAPPSANPEIYQDPGLIPRHTIDELLHCLNQTQGAIECLPLGIFVLDQKTRVISSNPAALQFVRRPYTEVLGQQVKYLFSREDEPCIMEALRRTLLRPDAKARSEPSFLIHSGKTQASVSLLKNGSKPAGWVIALSSIRTSNNSSDQT